MGRKFIYILVSVSLFLFGCYSKEEADFGQNGLVLDFSLQDNVATRAEDITFESRVTHLDVFFFNSSGDKIHYERILADGSPAGEKSVAGITLATLQGAGTVKVYVVANSTLPTTTLETVTTVENLKGQKETTTYINLTGYTGFEYDLPQTFLMTGLATEEDDTNLPNETNYQGINFSSVETTENYKIKVRLVRAAAKVEMHFKKKPDSGHIFAFGMPKKDASADFTPAELENIAINSIGSNYSYIHNSYYIRNLRYVTPFWGEATDSDKRKTSTITNSGYMVPNKTNEVDEVKVTAYIYSYSWGGKDISESVFEKAPFLIVNLPAIIYKDNSKATGAYLERNYYEIPFRTAKDGEKFKLERNHFYKITAIVDAPGAQTSMEPVKLDPIYYEAYPWNEKVVDIGGEVADVSYLNLNTYAIEMHNSTTNSEIKFASSSPISNVELVRAYYLNKAGKEITNTNPTASATPNVLNGTITVNSVYPPSVDNVIMYMTFRVTNKDGKQTTFTVTQYPTVYIQGILGAFSYRTDFNNTDLLRRGSDDRWDNKNYVAATWSNNKWSLAADYNTYTTFNSKEAGNNPDANGNVDMKYYYWTYSSWRGWSIAYKTNLAHKLNPRMYHITITTTSEDYKLGRPKLDSNGYTDNSDANNQMVSPSFMIASGLGATQAMTAAEAAKTHCKEYAETYYDSNGTLVRLEDWRLPTTAEIKIIANYQQNSVAMDVLLTGNKYWSASGTAVETGVAGDTGDPKVRCVRDVYTASPAK